MSLSLDDVRNKRFRMARKNGYEVLEVDEFVDEVEETFGQLFEENQSLKKQVEALKAAPAPTAAAGDKPAADKPTGTGSGDVKAPAASATSQPTAPAPAPVGERIVVTTSKEASSAVVRLVEMTTDQAERLVAEATAEAGRLRVQASESATKVETEARAHAERLQADAVQRAESLDRETEARRRELFGDLETQREQLTSTVAALRNFESTYRGNLTRHLQHQIEVLATGREEPADAPAGASADAKPTAGTHDGAAAQGQQRSEGGSAAKPAESDTPTTGGGSASDTPRLDALLGDQR